MCACPGAFAGRREKGSGSRLSAPLAVETLGLQRAQEVEDVLLLRGRQLVEFVDHCVRFGAVALMRLDRLQQIVGPAVMQEVDALSDAPQRRGAELISCGVTLDDAIG